MIFITNINKYTQTRKKISTETLTIEANDLEDFISVIRSLGFDFHDLHFYSKMDDPYLYLIRIQGTFDSSLEQQKK